MRACRCVANLPAVAICKRCGREYVWLPPDADVDFRDHYLFQGRPCGGFINRHPTEDEARQP